MKDFFILIFLWVLGWGGLEEQTGENKSYGMKQRQDGETADGWHKRNHRMSEPTCGFFGHH
ncbi:MAG: hypothetical protein J5654_01095 [Victivallales bacterium]|nr:hypothetical protein [Victivallales bacterium]